MSKTGDRTNKGKPRLSFNILGYEANAGEARVWEACCKDFGGKYNRGNWQIGMPWTEAADSLLRHMAKFLNGEDIDEESGLPHVDHISCCAKIVAQSYHTRKDLDDRDTNKTDEAVKEDIQTHKRSLSELSIG